MEPPQRASLEEALNVRRQRIAKEKGRVTQTKKETSKPQQEAPRTEWPTKSNPDFLAEAIAVRKQRIVKEKRVSDSEEQQETTIEDETSDLETSTPPQEQPSVKKLVEGLKSWSNSLLYKEKPMSVPDHAIPKTDEERAAHYLKQENQLILEKSTSDLITEHPAIETGEFPDSRLIPTISAPTNSNEPQVSKEPISQSRSPFQRFRDKLVERRHQQAALHRKPTQSHTPEPDRSIPTAEELQAYAHLRQQQVRPFTVSPLTSSMEADSVPVQLSLKQHDDDTAIYKNFYEGAGVIHNDNEESFLTHDSEATTTAMHIPKQPIGQSEHRNQHTLYRGEVPQTQTMLHQALMKGLNQGNWKAFDALPETLVLLEERSNIPLTKEQEEQLSQHLRERRLAKQRQEYSSNTEEEPPVNLEKLKKDIEEELTASLNNLEHHTGGVKEASSNILQELQEKNVALKPEEQLSDEILQIIATGLDALAGDAKAEEAFMAMSNVELVHHLFTAQRLGIITDAQFYTLHNTLPSEEYYLPSEAPRKEITPTRQRRRQEQEKKGKRNLGQRLSALVAPFLIGTGSLLGAPGVDAVQTNFSPHAQRPRYSSQVHAAEQPVIPESTQQKMSDENVAEFMLMPLVEQFKQERLKRLASDPAFAERVNHELVNADTLNFLYLGIDQTRDRPDDFNGLMRGNADSFIIVTFNPHTFETQVISIPRDTYAPELNDRINSVTTREDGDTLAKALAEEATARPIDRVIKTNIDFIPEFLDTMFPQGLEIDVPYDIYDEEYPDINYSIKTLAIKKGKHVMTGKKLLEYARSRHNTTDFSRSERQRQIIAEVAKQVVPRILDDLKQGKTTTLENLRQAFRVAKANENLFSELDLELVFDQIEKSIRSFNAGALVKIAVNSTDEALNLGIGTGFIKTWGPDRGEQGKGGLENLSPEEEERVGKQYILKVVGTDTRETKPTQLGNYLDYWSHLRQQVASAILQR